MEIRIKVFIQRCGEMAELKGRELIIITPPYLSQHYKRKSRERAVLARGV